MKLKKIASLMLAGVMAVSMLAGCSNTAVDPEPTPDPTPDSNYGTTLWNYLDEGKSKITFQSNSALDTALQTAVEYAGSLSVATNYWLGDTIVELNTDGINVDRWVEFNPVLVDSLQNVAISLSESTDADNAALHVRANDWTGMEATLNQINGTGEHKNDDDVTAVALYVIDGTVGINAALDKVAEDLDDIIRDLDIVSTNTALGVEYEYKYTGSVSVASKSITKDGMNVNFIAVQIDRTTVQR